MREPFDDFQDYYIEKTNTVRFEVIQFTKSIEMGQITQEFKQYDYASITGESISIKEYPKHNIYFSFQVGGNPRTIRETLIGPMFEGDNQADAKMSADKKYQSLQKQLKKVAVEGTIEDEIRVIFSE